MWNAIASSIRYQIGWQIAKLNSEGFTNINMAIFRQYIAPFLIFLVFVVALLAVSARIFLPTDMAAPAPIEDVESASKQAPASQVDAAAGSPPVEAPILPTSAGSLN